MKNYQNVYIWTDIKLSNHYGTIFGEETITDLILLDLAKQNFFNISILQTPKPKEAKQGTDWEWYVGSQKYGWVRYAIQAKKLNLNSSTYDSLNHKVGLPPKDERQIKILRTFSNENGAIPLYNFYNYYPAALEKDHWQCSKKFDIELLGWTFTTLKNVEFSVQKRGYRSFDKIHMLPQTLPIRCLFSCPMFVSLYFIQNLLLTQDFF